MLDFIGLFKKINIGNLLGSLIVLKIIIFLSGGLRVPHGVLEHT